MSDIIICPVCDEKFEPCEDEYCNKCSRATCCSNHGYLCNECAGRVRVECNCCGKSYSPVVMRNVEYRGMICVNCVDKAINPPEIEAIFDDLRRKARRYNPLTPRNP